MGLSPCTDILCGPWPPGRSCDAIPIITETIENIVYWLCEFACMADEIKCVACGQTPPFNYLWPDCVDIECGAIVWELCAEPTLWYWDGTTWNEYGCCLYTLSRYGKDDNDFVTTAYAPSAAWKNYAGVSSASGSVTVPIAGAMVSIGVSCFHTFTGGTYISNSIYNTTTAWRSHWVSHNQGPRTLYVVDPAPALGVNTYQLQNFEHGGVATANAHGFVIAIVTEIG